MLIHSMLGPIALAALQAHPAPQDVRPQVGSDTRRLTAGFVRNEGQVDPRALFYSRSSRLTAFATRDGIVLRSTDRSQSDSVFFTFEGASPDVRIEGERPISAGFHVFAGATPKDWHVDLPAYESVRYREVYPGVSLRLYEQGGLLEYDVECECASRLAQLIVRVEGAAELQESEDGGLLVRTAHGELRQRAPLTTYTGSDGQRHPIACRMRVLGADRFAFQVNASDADGPVCIDPGFDYATYLGGSSGEIAFATDVDDTGAIYVTGATASLDFPTTPGAMNTVVTSNDDSFVTKLDPTLSQLVYSTIVNNGQLFALRVDSAHRAHVGGWAKPGFPTTPGSFSTAFSNATLIPAVAVLNDSGSALIYGSSIALGEGSVKGLAVGSGDETVCVGGIAAPGFPFTPGAFNQDWGNGQAGGTFVVRFNGLGSALRFAAGMGYHSICNCVALDEIQNVYVGGAAGPRGPGWNQPSLPTTPGAPQPNYAGGVTDGFVAKLDPFASQLVYATFLGSPFQLGFDTEEVRAIAVDSAGCAYAGGDSEGPGFPTTPDSFEPTITNGLGGYVTKLNPSGTGLVYSTYVTGWGGRVTGLAVDASGCAYACGNTVPFGFPTTPGAPQTQSLGGNGDGFVCRVSPDGSNLLFSTYVGGGGESGEEATGITIAPDGSAVVLGHTNSTTFPTTPGSFQPTGHFTIGYSEAWVVRQSPLYSGTGVASVGSGNAGCSGPHTLRVGSTPQIGNKLFAVECGNAPASSLGLFLIGSQILPPGSQPLGLGVELLVDLASPELFALPIASNGVGGSAVNLPIPNQPLLAGHTYGMQALWLWPPGACSPSPFQLSSSDTLVVTLQP